MIVVNYGAGTNSTALIVGAIQKAIKIDLIVFADTGSERPETYQYLETFGDWLRPHGLHIEVVRWIRKLAPHAGEFIPLHVACEQQKTLPSKAFGYSGCTSKWKQQPIDGYIKTSDFAKDVYCAGGLIERWIGYDADEPERADRMLAKNPDPSWFKWRAPLVEWGWGRAECVAAIKSAGLPSPGKSACWLCPSMTKNEILQLRREHPDLHERALAIEANADLGASVKGLGRRFAWADLDAQLSFDDRPPEVDCGCYDGAKGEEL